MASGSSRNHHYAKERPILVPMPPPAVKGRRQDGRPSATGAASVCVLPVVRAWMHAGSPNCNTPLPPWYAHASPEGVFLPHCRPDFADRLKRQRRALPMGWDWRSGGGPPSRPSVASAQVHCPFSHVALPGQTVPQLPQLAGSVVRSAQ